MQHVRVCVQVIDTRQHDFSAVDEMWSQLDLTSLAKNALLALGLGCALMAALIVVGSIFPTSGHLRILVRLVS
jgi:hypothetical protein